MYRLGRHRGKFALVYYRDGKRHRVSLGTADADEAARLAPLVWADLSRPRDTTVTALWQAYEADMEGRAIVERLTHSRRALDQTFGDLHPGDITIGHCRDHTAKRRAAGISDGTIHTELGHLRMVLRWAVKNRHIAEAPAIERPAKPASSTPHLSPDEIERLLAAAELPHVKLFIMLAYQTGGRRAALLELTWGRVDFEAGTIDLRNPAITRPHKGRAVVPMNRTLRAALIEARAGAVGDHVIEWGGKPVKNVRRGLAEAAKRAGLPHVSPHMFRHSAAVQIMRRTGNAHRTAQFLAHSNVSMVEKVYGRFRPDYLQDEADALEIGAGDAENTQESQ